MKRVFACLVIMVALPVMTSSTRYKSSNAAPLSAVAFAGHTNSTGFTECACEFGTDGVCPCCGESLWTCGDKGTNKQTAQSPVCSAAGGASPLSLWADAMLFVAAFLGGI